MTITLFWPIRVLIIPTTRLLFGATARSYWFFIVVRPDAINDHALIEHELEHCRQAWRLPFLHILLYAMSSRYRRWAEVEAFRVQVAHGMRVEDARTALWDMYREDVSAEELVVK